MGFETSDDAGIYRLDDNTAVITTADYITPPVNDPYLFGQIAAANALSDIYAMGGKPITCLNLVNFPSKKLAPEVLHQIAAGALDKITEAGASLVGGHTIDDDEPKFGLAVTGVVHPDKYWSNRGAQIGDLLILTKPIGSGVIFNANIKKWVSPKALEECLQSITALNKTAAEVMGAFDIHAATDVTGFGLAGHGLEIAQGSGVQMEIQMDDIPIMSEAMQMYQKGMSTGSNRSNQNRVQAYTAFKAAIPELHRQIVYDPQTSGGLLVSVPAQQGVPLLKALHQAGVKDARTIGRINPLKGEAYLVFSG